MSYLLENTSVSGFVFTGGTPLIVTGTRERARVNPWFGLQTIAWLNFPSMKIEIGKLRWPILPWLLELFVVEVTG